MEQIISKRSSKASTPISLHEMSRRNLFLFLGTRKSQRLEEESRYLETDERTFIVVASDVKRTIKVKNIFFKIFWRYKKENADRNAKDI